ncbi:MAG: ATP synthase F1 subunit delta [Armatimonadota bacterium]|nr:ATP synthase F1 subunit delta [Armatimonadota bacterium]
MIDSRISRRYVTALYDAAEAADAVELIESDLGLISYTLETIPSLGEALLQPLIPASKKKQIAEEIFGDKVHEVTLHYLFLVIDMGRAGVIEQTESEFVQIANARRGIVLAETRSAVELAPDQVSRLKERLETYTGKQVDLKLIIDESLLGGLTVRIGDTVLDGSVAGYLARLREKLLGDG